jgi:hypothetical protein
MECCRRHGRRWSEPHYIWSIQQLSYVVWTFLRRHIVSPCQLLIIIVLYRTQRCSFHSSLLPGFQYHMIILYFMSPILQISCRLWFVRLLPSNSAPSMLTFMWMDQLAC